MVIFMNTSTILKEIREKNRLTQDEMAEKLFVTRQAVSRWENDETIPNTEALKLISKIFNISINTLLGTPQILTCQCCGMPLNDDENISRETDNTFNEEYCKWCYTGGEFVYKSLDELMNFLVPYISEMHKQNKAEIKAMLEKQLPSLKRWKQV